MTPAEWAKRLLAALGFPQTPANVRFLEAWEAKEGGAWHNTATGNPLNTTQAEPGYHKTGTQGDIGAYASWASGIKATVTTLRNGDYGDLLAALKSGRASRTAEYGGLYTWSGHGYSSLAGIPAPRPSSGALPPLPGSTGGDSSSSGGGFSVGGVAKDLGAAALGPLGILTGSLSSSWAKDAAKLALTGAFVVGGVGLVVLGLYQGVQPAVAKVESVAGDAAKVAGVAAL